MLMLLILFLLARALALLSITIGSWFSNSFYGCLEFFSNDVCSIYILIFTVTFSCQSFLFSIPFRITLTSSGNFSLLICFDAAPFYFSRKGTSCIHYISTFTDIIPERSPNFLYNSLFRISCIILRQVAHILSN